MDHVQKHISDWAEETFIHNDRGIALHLIREAAALGRECGVTDREIARAVEIELGKNKPHKSIEEKTADVTILALTLAGYCGFSLEESIAAKHAVNIVRQWGIPDEQGIVEHVA